jgi:hypothetical protein
MLSIERQRLFSLYDRGLVTVSELDRGFVGLLIDAKNDDDALALCKELPVWFRSEFTSYLTDLANHDYRFRWFGIGDTRSQEQIEADTARHQEFLRRISPQILNAIVPVGGMDADDQLACDDSEA